MKIDIRDINKATQRVVIDEVQFGDDTGTVYLASKFAVEGDDIILKNDTEHNCTYLKVGDIDRVIGALEFIRDNYEGGSVGITMEYETLGRS